MSRRRAKRFGTSERSRAKRTEDQRAADQQKIAHWMAIGKRPHEIKALFEAEGRELSRETIHKDAREIRAEWAHSAHRDVDTVVTERLAELRALKREYWDAWFKSKGVKLTAIKGTGKANDKDWSTTQVREVESPGDPEYLRGVQWCLAEENKILGLHAPVQHEMIVRWEAERIAKEYGLSTEEVLNEAEAILKGQA